MSPCASAVGLVACRLESACSRRAVCFAVLLMVLLLPPVLATWGLAHHIYFDRSGVPDLEPFIRFELSTIGKVYDARGTVLVELAREYRQVVSYEEVAPVLRHAITVAVRIGFDDNRTLGDKETGGRAALPIFREIMLRTYQQELVGSVPSFPRETEDGIDQYLQRQAPDLGDSQAEDHRRTLTASPHHQGEQAR